MKLQKLVYISHGWYLGLVGEPLISEDVEAWKWGPVVRSLYRDFADYGSSPITAVPMKSEIDPVASRLLERVWEVYRRFTAAQLSSMTHATGTPWSDAFRSEGKPAIIPTQSIRQHYKMLAKSR